jgi:hypothetical protein
LGQDFARKYERIIWVDSDVVINPDAPLITEGVPVEKVGAVDEFAFPSPKDHPIAVRKVAEAMRLSPEAIWDTPERFYGAWGLPRSFPQVVQTGVLVLSPQHHKELCGHTYHNYEDRGGATWGEMHPFSFELLGHDLVHWMDSRFNTIWAYVKAIQYPRLFDNRLRLLQQVKGVRRFAFKLEETRLRKPVTTTFLNSYFLHFAGCPRDMRGLDMSVKPLTRIGEQGIRGPN